MDNATYATLTRQSGLMAEMQTIANNIANLGTTGFRAEGVIFAEHVAALARPEDDLSMATAEGRRIDLGQGAVQPTGGTFDLAIEGPGFFLLDTPEAEALTRAGHFTPNEAGELVTSDGQRLLDAGGAAIFVPPDARAVTIGRDGTLSADGRPLTQIGLWQAADPTDLRHVAGTMFEAPGGVEPVLDGVIIQGHLEASNVDPVGQVARMIEVQRAYELGQAFLDREDNRIRDFLRAMGQR